MNAVRVNDKDDNHDVVISASSNVMVNGLPSVRVGDKDFPSNNTKIQGSPNVFVNGLAKHRVGDKDDNNNISIVGSSNVIVN